MSGYRSRRFSFSLAPTEALALLRVVDEALRVRVRNEDVPRSERICLGSVQRALRAIVESPEFIAHQATKPVKAAP